jgi:predicted esterase
MRLSETIARVTLVFSLTAPALGVLQAQVNLGAVPFQPGALVEQVVSHADSTQSYALYLPSIYGPNSRRPLLVLMDPRGRAMLPMGLARNAAESLGFIVLSSYNTRSDEAADYNGPALAAILADAEQFFSIDGRRVYLAGFSGTAREAWLYGYRLRNHVAGLIGFGAGFPKGLDAAPPGGPPPLVYFGGAGTTDFNYEEVRKLERLLDSIAIPHRMEYYDGPHGWPTEPVMAGALYWLELQAMRSGLRPRDPRWIDSVLQVQRDSARRLEATGHQYAAYLLYRWIARDFAGLQDVGTEAARAAELDSTSVVESVRRQLDAESHRVTDYSSQMVGFFMDARKSPVPQPLERASQQLRIRDLQRRARNTTDSLGAQASQRMLENVFVLAAFYEPREYLAVREAERALALLALANEIKPGAPMVCYNRARALALLGRRDEAMSHLDCWARAIGSDVERLAQDSNLATLRSHPGFQAWLARLRESSEAGRP